MKVVKGRLMEVERHERMKFLWRGMELMFREGSYFKAEM
jgi:hypothetical protein